MVAWLPCITILIIVHFVLYLPFESYKEKELSASSFVQKGTDNTSTSCIMNGKLVALFVVISLASLCYASPARFEQHLQGLSAKEILNFLSSKRENAKISESMLIIFKSAMQDACI